MPAIKPELVWVVAREGVRIARENAPRSFIERIPARVALTPYYSRQIQDKDLVVVAPPISEDE